MRKHFEAEQARVRRAVRDHVGRPNSIAVVKAPPGSGKTLLLCELSTELVKQDKRVAIATQTNVQSDDLCRRLASAGARPFRYVSSQSRRPDLGSSVTVFADKSEMPRGAAIVVANTSKWGAVGIADPFDVLLVDEAWQMTWSKFIPLDRVAGRFVLIGDPGQIPPTVTVDTSRWETSPRPPHRPAPEVALEIAESVLVEELPASRRLPHDTVEMLQPFYEFSFGSWARPGDRRLVTARRGRGPIDRALDQLADGSMTALTLPTPDYVCAVDQELAELAVNAVAVALGRASEVVIADQPDGPRRRLEAAHVGVASKHRSTNEEIQRRLQARGLGAVRVDTPERWQGLQCDLMVALHPLSGVQAPTAFDLETGRLCVMASRHRAGLIVVSRDHIGETLENALPVADQSIGREDLSGRGHNQHRRFWQRLATMGRISNVA